MILGGRFQEAELSRDLCVSRVRADRDEDHYGLERGWIQLRRRYRAGVMNYVPKPGDYFLKATYVFLVRALILKLGAETTLYRK